MKKIFFYFAMMLLPLMAIAQNNNSNESYAPKTFEFKHAIGGAASMMSGYGLSYQYHITPKDRLEASVFMFMDTHEDVTDDNQYSYNEDNWFGSIGLEYHRLLASRRNGKLFLMVGAGYDFDKNSYDYPTDYPYTYNDESYNRTLLGGAGFVVEVYIPTINVTFDLDIGVAYRHKMNYEDDVHVSTDQYLGIGVGGGIYYTF